MKHFLTEQEFKEFILKPRTNGAEFNLACQDTLGDTECITFRAEWFICRCFLYSIPQTLDVGLIQEDIDNGWDEAIHDVWIDITSTCGWKPFFKVKDSGNNLF